MGTVKAIFISAWHPVVARRCISKNTLVNRHSYVINRTIKNQQHQIMTTCNSIYFKEVSRMLTILALFLFFAFCSRPAEISLQDYGNIQEGFISPADTNKPWCYYYWIGDDISKEGLTKDMEAMKEFGLGAAFIGNINPDEVDGPVPLFSDQWWDIMVHSV